LKVRASLLQYDTVQSGKLLPTLRSNGHNTLEMEVGNSSEKVVNNNRKGVVPEDLNLHLHYSEIHE
jgi:hypothetical protein